MSEYSVFMHFQGLRPEAHAPTCPPSCASERGGGGNGKTRSKIASLCLRLYFISSMHENLRGPRLLCCWRPSCVLLV